MLQPKNKNENRQGRGLGADKRPAMCAARTWVETSSCRCQNTFLVMQTQPKPIVHPLSLQLARWGKGCYVLVTQLHESDVPCSAQQTTGPQRNFSPSTAAQMERRWPHDGTTSTKQKQRGNCDTNTNNNQPDVSSQISQRKAKHSSVENIKSFSNWFLDRSVYDHHDSLWFHLFI